MPPPPYGDAIPVQFHVISSKSQDHLILGREFMTEYQVLVDLIMGEARNYKPERDIQLTVLMVDGEGKAQPLPLPTISHEPCIPDVMFVDLNQVDDDKECPFGSDEPSAPKAESKEYHFQDLLPIPEEAEIWGHENFPPTTSLKNSSLLRK